MGRCCSGHFSFLVIIFDDWLLVLLSQVFGEYRHVEKRRSNILCILVALYFIFENQVNRVNLVIALHIVLTLIEFHALLLVNKLN